MKLLYALAAGLMIAGCAQAQAPDPVRPGQYKDYHDYLTANTQGWHWKGVPASLEQSFKACGLTVMINQLPSQDYRRLNAFARGELQISAQERAEIEGRMQEKFDDGSFERSMEYVCPDTMRQVTEFRAKNG